MSSSVMRNIRSSRSGASLPVSQSDPARDDGNGLRRRLASLSVKMQPIASTAPAVWALRSSKSLSTVGEQAGDSIKKWWEWGCCWILSRKPVFAMDLEMNEEETKTLGSHNKGSWRHVFYKLKSEVKKLLTSHNNVTLPQTCRY